MQEDLDLDSFNLLSYWKKVTLPLLDPESGEEAVAPKMPHVALLARLFHGIDATSCQSERNFYALGGLLDQLRCSMGDTKVEMVMMLRLNQTHIKEVAELQNGLKRWSQVANAAGLADVAMRDATPHELAVEIDVKGGCPGGAQGNDANKK
ncbi:unnamed protein product [Choristocarpus tenellus]